MSKFIRADGVLVMRVRRLPVALLPIYLAWPTGSAFGHAFGQRYDLPLPLWLYLWGAAGVVAVTFVLLALFSAWQRKIAGSSRRTGSNMPAACGHIPRAVLLPFQILSVAAFVLVLAAGLFGRQDPFKNIAPTAVWVVGWVGLAYVCAFIGNVWALISPWSVAFAWMEIVAGRGWVGTARSPPIRYPAWLGVWPAAILFLAFAWAELHWPGRDMPRNIAAVALVYTLVTWTGCLVFGRDAWLRGGELFSVFFGLVGRFAPLRFVPVDGRWTWHLRPYAVGLLDDKPASSSVTAFVLLMLSTVTIDGLFETPLWARTVDLLLGSQPTTGGPAGDYIALASAALVLAPVFFATVYLGVIALMAFAAGAPQPSGGCSMGKLAGQFVLSLVPIGIAYHLAHYFSFLALAGQFLIPLSSDPFGFGWDLFGTTLYRIDIGIVDARAAWYTAVAAIVGGHVVAVWLAHETALLVFKDRRSARRSQYPMTGLMVGYTVLSLWILAQPIVEAR
ncbi:MAG TPA: hypothetical protein VF295_02435 [Candidatus Limnocylindria bacterium]